MKSNVDVLREILALVKEELNEVGAENGIGYTMPDGKYHIFIYVDNADEKIYVVEPNKVVDGAHEPLGENYLAAYNDFAELVIGCEWCFEQFEADCQISNDRLSTLLHNAIICLEEYGCDGEQLEIDLGITAEEYDVVMDDNTSYEIQPVKNKIYGFSEIDSGGFFNGNESFTKLFSSEHDCVEAAYERYCEVWKKAEAEGLLNNEFADNDVSFLSEEEFKLLLFSNGYTYIQLPDSHIQFECFEQEVELSTAIEERVPVKEDPLLLFVRNEVPFRVTEILERPLTKELEEALVDCVYDNSDVMFDYDGFDEFLENKYDELVQMNTYEIAINYLDNKEEKLFSTSVVAVEKPDAYWTAGFIRDCFAKSYTGDSYNRAIDSVYCVELQITKNGEYIDHDELCGDELLDVLRMAKEFQKDRTLSVDERIMAAANLVSGSSVGNAKKDEIERE